MNLDTNKLTFKNIRVKTFTSYDTFSIEYQLEEFFENHPDYLFISFQLVGPDTNTKVLDHRYSGTLIYAAC